MNISDTGAKRAALMLLLLTSPPALAEPSGDPWPEVPALPTSCYAADDTFQDDAYAAAEALQSEKMRQDEINQATAQQMGEIDPMQLQQRMMTFMMEHPEDAQKAIMALNQGGQQMQEQLPEMSERSGQLEARLQGLNAEYAAALSAAIDPIEGRRQALRNSKGWCSPESLASDAALSGEANRAYDSLCAQWWQEGGAFHAWLTEFRQYQADYAAQQDEYAATTTINYQILGIPRDRYRPTNDLGAASEYLRRAAQVYSKRQQGPLSEEPLQECTDGHG